MKSKPRLKLAADGTVFIWRGKGPEGIDWWPIGKLKKDGTWFWGVSGAYLLGLNT